ncbi:redox-sensitive transcriptional activator SoxR [Yoonia sediminilitoris]|uniref:MerR family transcriptional regulator n=1 Tax=Yoonia sediminilitoris TaxID=1286148 RepID=A0A2T6KS28_9RHOB|nr:redox-sensitive transcriptional activator SoxR [Yoonia sediminilitoris]PUB19325.1 MerR family transcriptional regulator [Yoonia sediminilitoris]RCW99493.1 MerR family transcriptional regulator [Yoonia sediminilitoris]
MTQGLSIGDLSERTGLAVSAIRFYETHDIVKPLRNKGGHRRYGRADIRRLSFVMAAQNLGFPLSEIATHLRDLPDHKAPSKADWTRISKSFRHRIDARIAALEELRDKLDGCIGCGCLSLKACALYNPNDEKAVEGPGPRNLTRLSG